MTLSSRKKKKNIFIFTQISKTLKKRFDRERKDIYQYCWEPIAANLLDVLDSLERALGHAVRAGEKTMADGIKLTIKQLQDIFAKNGVSRIDAMGKLFNPQWHETTARAPSAKARDIVISEESPGYLLHEKLLRPARVVISSGEKKAA